MKYYYKRREIVLNDKVIELTYLENRILKIIFEETTKCASYEKIGKTLYENMTRDKTLSKEEICVLACRLRKKGVPIETVRGFGLKISNPKKGEL